MRVIAIDPGTTQSAYVIWTGVALLGKDIVDNEELLRILSEWPDKPFPMVIEQIRSYGMPIGASTIDTVFWSGRFWEAWSGERYLMPRLEVKNHICHNGSAKDSNIIQALVDRFAYGEPNRGKGVKASPGFFYGFKSDIWQAMALAVTFIDQNAADDYTVQCEHGNT